MYLLLMHDSMKPFVPACVFALLLTGCAAADGNWPSLMSDAERKGAKTATPPPASSPEPSVVPLAVIPKAGETPPVPAAEALAAGLAPAVTRLQQEMRAFEYTLERLTQNQQALVVAKAAAAGKSAGSPEGLAHREAERRRTQLLATLDDIRETAGAVAGQLALAGLGGDAIAQPFLDTGKLLGRLAAAQSLPDGPSLEKLTLGLTAAEKRLEGADRRWKTQAAKLRTSTAAAGKADPDRINWNQAQIDLTRVNQSARSMEAVRAELERLAGTVAVLAAAGTDVSALLVRVGTLLQQADQRLADNETLVADSRRLLERS
jgi:hypothetical protein